MVIRIRLGRSRSHRKSAENHNVAHHNVALALGSLLTPAAVMALVLAIWPLAAALKFAGAFPIGEGVFSHWQAWLLVAFALQSMALAFNRSDKPGKRVPEDLPSSDRRLANPQF
jgi:hypothetical protein